MSRLHKLALAAVLSPLALPAAAQTADPAILQAERDALAKLAWMDGAWRGEAVTGTGSSAHHVTQTERIGPLLGGTVKLLEGKGFNGNGSVGFNAFGVISYDPASRRYTLHSYAQGHAGDFVLTPTDTGYVWEIPLGPMTIRYTATLQDGIWTEVGDQIVAGQPPRRFFEMNLRRFGDSAWPAAGGLGPK